MPSRREVVTTIAAFTASTSGCSVIKTESPGLESKISVSGQVLEQMTTADPLQIRFTLTNESDESLRLSAGDANPLEIFSRLPGETGILVLVPMDTIDAGEVRVDIASEQTDGCWRFVTPDGGDPEFIVQMDADRLTLSAGGEHSVTHRVYYDRNSDKCFPAGEYSTSHQIERIVEEGEENPSVLVAPTLEFDETATATLRVDGPM